MRTLLLVGLLALPAQVSASDAFESKVRPILAEHCISCHGSKSQKGGLRLDSREAMLKGGDGGPAVDIQDPSASRFLEVVHYDDEPKMPPKGKLAPAQLAALDEWVKAGAPWPKSVVLKDGPDAPDPAKHWSFQPLRDPATPKVADPAWAKTSIDPYILVALEAKKIKPSADADRRTWLRRVTLDLIGLPPTPAELAAFEADKSSNAHATVVDRLLASPHYGERWGRHWLDVARYSDTKGYVFMEEPNYPWAWTYRDYVIKAFNSDKPYDQFIKEQIAADKVDTKGDHDAIAALGFVTVGGRFLNNQQDIIDDRIDVVTRGFMGLTVGCARCHDHKFDPIPTEDYYSLYGVFAASPEPGVPPPLGDPAKHAEYAKFEAELKARETALEGFRAEKYNAVMKVAREHAGDYLLAAQAGRNKPDTREFMLIADGADLNPRMVSAWRRFLESTRQGHDSVFAPFNALAKLPLDGFSAKSEALLTAWKTKPDPKAPINAVVLDSLARAGVTSPADVAKVYSNLLKSAYEQGQDRARRAPEAKALPIAAWEELRGVFEREKCPTTLRLDQFNDLQLLPDRPAQAKVRELRDKVAQWRDTGPGAPPRAMAIQDQEGVPMPRVFVRGNPGNQGKEIPRRFLRLVSNKPPEPFKTASGRKELAEAIASPTNPLTARVFVNRVWMHHFGTPLVGTPSDFGLRSDPPTNPDLLDHLATSFIKDGWSVKALHRRIVLSRTYLQSSADRPEARAVDSENVLYWRFNRRRLDFESTRDALLAVADRLDPTVGGRSVDDMMQPGRRRRTLYGRIDRLNLPLLFRTFDFPDPSTSSAKRDATTVAPQALTLMNHPVWMDCAKAILARPEVAAAPTPEEKVKRIYKLALLRDPDAAEVGFSREYLATGGPDAAWRFAHALLMTNEFVMID